MEYTFSVDHAIFLDNFSTATSANDTYATSSTKTTDAGSSTSPLEVLSIFLSVLGFLANLGTVATLLKHGKTFSPTSKLLLQNQAGLDTVSCGSALILTIQKPYYWKTGNLAFDTLVCHLWHSQQITWFAMWASIHNLICIALERHMAVVYPLQYKKITRRHLTAVIISIYILDFVLMLPNAQLVRMANGQCVGEFFIRPQSAAILINKIWAVVAFFMIYALPTSLMVYLYGRVVYTMNKSQNTATANKASTQLTRASIAITAVYVFTQSWVYWYFTLGVLEVFPFVVGSVEQKVNVLMSAVNSAANPFLYLAFMPAFRRAVSSTFLPCKRNRTVPENGSSDAHTQSTDEQRHSNTA